jgi:hypothetical protein
LERPGVFRILPSQGGLAWSGSTDHRALAGGAEFALAADNRLWFMADPPATGVVKAERVMPDADHPVTLTLEEGETALLSLEPDENGSQLWLADSRVGQPGLVLLAGITPPDARRSAPSTGTVAVVVPEAHARAALRLERADGEPGALPSTLRRIRFGPAKAGQVSWGLTDLALAAGGALEVALPTGNKRLRLALPAGTAAALLEGGAVARTLWSGGTPLAETLDSDAEQLLVQNTHTEPGVFSILCAAADRGLPLTLTRRALFHTWQGTAGTLRLELTPGGPDPALVHLAGAATDALLLQQDGTWRRGQRLTVTADATLLVTHGPGLVVAWLDRADGQAWPAVGLLPPLDAVAATLPLTGQERTWAINLTEPVLLQATTSAPVLVGLRYPAAAPAVSVWMQGAHANLFLPKGNTVLGLRSLQDGPLTGTLDTIPINATDIGEGLGPTVRLAAGDARLYRFQLHQAGPVGVGVRGGADSARVRLLAEDGRVLATGSVAMATLEAGHYFLLVENRADAAAVEIQPALVGLTQPDRGPPEDVKRRYWERVTAPEGGGPD